MKRPVRLSFFILNFSFLISLSSCSNDNDDTPYPNLITEMADCPTDSEGTMKSIVLDDDTRFSITNQQTNLKPNVTYRCLADYVVEGNGQVTLYGLKSCPILRDSTAIAQCDPVNVVSLWRTRRYINMHLRPMTMDQEMHDWGFITDSIRGRHAYLRLHHRQGSDPTAYSTDLYASLPLDLVEADTITLRIRTFSGTNEQTFPSGNN